MDRMIKWVWLTTLKGMYSAKITALLDSFDSIDEIYSAQEEEYRNISMLRTDDIKQLCDKSTDYAQQVIERTQISGGYIMTYDSVNYPERLKRLINPPYVLYIKGNFDFSKKRVNIGVVGTRDCSDYGYNVTSKMCVELAIEGFTVVSGLAYGIDSIAAESALRVGSETLAVLGCGIDIVYPSNNEDLYKQVIMHGAIISEYPPLTQPLRTNFPERNRIIAALSDCLLVTEAPKQSGALITAKYAYEMGIDIFSVPGNVFMEKSVGTNKLIKSGAKPALNPRDIIDEYLPALQNVEKPVSGTNFLNKGLQQFKEQRLNKTEMTDKSKEKINNVQSGALVEIKPKTIDKERFSSLSEEERIIADLILSTGKISVDEIIRQSGIATSRVNSMLPLMEIEGIVTKHAGNLYTISEE